MSFAHHSDNPMDDDPEQFRLLKKLQEQQQGNAQREWPDGRISGDDDGELAFKIGPHPDQELVVIDFGKEVTWVAMPPKQAIEVAQLLIRHARGISKEPLRIILN